MIGAILLVLAATIGLSAFAGQARAAEPPPPPEPKQPPVNLPKLIKGLTPEYVALAKKYAKIRDLPVLWILTTIVVESAGKAKAVGDNGKSYGLMQINRVAHADLLKTLRVTDQQLFDPEINIAIGTYLMRLFLNDILAVLADHPSAAPLDVILRLSYKGPAYVMTALKAGRDPRTLPWAPPAIANWVQTSSAARALV